MLQIVPRANLHVAEHRPVVVECSALHVLAEFLAVLKIIRHTAASAAHTAAHATAAALRPSTAAHLEERCRHRDERARKRGKLPAQQFARTP